MPFRRRASPPAWLAALALAFVLALVTDAVRAAPAPAGERFAVLVSIDGLMPASYTAPDALGLSVPNLRRLVAEGASAEGVVGVLPSVTYPSHTTLLTGTPPGTHGIPFNTYFDPLGRSNDAWLWYAREVRVPTLVVWAEADFALPVKLLDGLDALVDDLTVRRMPRATHWLAHEEPAAVAQFIDEFIGR